MPKIYILLPVHNRREVTRGFVECLAAQTFSDYHLVLIDDGSTDGTAEMVQAQMHHSSVRGAAPHSHAALWVKASGAVGNCRGG